MAIIKELALKGHVHVKDAKEHDLTARGTADIQEEDGGHAYYKPVDPLMLQSLYWYLESHHMYDMTTLLGPNGFLMHCRC